VKSDQLWFPALSLRENPFRFTDAAVVNLPKVESRLFKAVEAVVEASEDALIIGEWGLGKTATAQALAEKYRGVFISGPSDMDKIEVEVLAGLVQLGLGDLKDLLKAGLYDFYWSQSHKTKDLLRGRCFYCPRHCDMRQVEPKAKSFSVKQLIETLSRFMAQLVEERIPCPFLSLVLSKAKLDGVRLFFDAPNEVTPNLIREFAQLCLRFQKAGAQILLYGTPQQCRALLEASDLFRKWRKVELSKPEPEFFIKLVEARARHFQEAHIIILTERSILHLAKQAGYNPREFCRLCSQVLTAARSRCRPEPIDEAFLEETGIHFAEPFAKRIEEAYRSYPETAENLKLLLDRLRSFGDWIVLVDHIEDLSEMVCCKPGTIYKYIQNLEQLGLVETKMAGRPLKKFLRVSQLLVEP